MKMAGLQSARWWWFTFLHFHSEPIKNKGKAKDREIVSEDVKQVGKSGKNLKIGKEPEYHMRIVEGKIFTSENKKEE